MQGNGNIDNYSDVISFLKGLLGQKSKKETDSAKLKPKQDRFVNLTNQEYQAPIKGEWFNSGDYSPDRPTDAKHPKGHKGIDMRAPGGTPVYPMASGKVTNVGTDPMGGNIVNVDHGNGIRTYYAHLGTITTRKGDIVSNNTQIGTVGESGNARGTVPHCHFQVWVNGQITNPSKFFSVPTYTRISKTEQRWLPGEEQVAKNWNIKSYLSRAASTGSQELLNKCNLFAAKAIKI